MFNIRFYKKDDGRWFADLPLYREAMLAGGETLEAIENSCEMVFNADAMLNLYSSGGTEVYLTISRKQFKGSDRLVTWDIEDMLGSGQMYMMETFNSKPLNMILWLCDVTMFMFENSFPDELYIKIL